MILSAPCSLFKHANCQLKAYFVSVPVAGNLPHRSAPRHILWTRLPLGILKVQTERKIPRADCEYNVESRERKGYEGENKVVYEKDATNVTGIEINKLIKLGRSRLISQ